MQTLKHIALSTVSTRIRFDGDSSSLGIIASEFEDMSTKNIIETVTIGIFLSIHASFPPVEDDCGRLDEIFTSPGWLSLKRVSLAINTHGHHRGLNEQEELRKLLETRFPRLSSSKSVSLDIKINGSP